MNPLAFSRPDIMVVESDDPATLAIVTRIYYETMKMPNIIDQDI